MSWKDLFSIGHDAGNDGSAHAAGRDRAVKVSMQKSLPRMDGGAFNAAWDSEVVEFGKAVLGRHLMQGEFVEVEMDGLHYMPPGVFFERAVGGVVADGMISVDAVRQRLSFTRGGEPDRVANAIAFKAAAAPAKAAG